MIPVCDLSFRCFLYIFVTFCTFLFAIQSQVEPRMPNFISLVDLLPLIPELILFLTLVVAMLADLFVPSNRRNDVLVSVSLGGIVLTMLAELQLYGAGYTGFYGTVVADNYSILLELVYLLIGLMLSLIHI